MYSELILQTFDAVQSQQQSQEPMLSTTHHDGLLHSHHENDSMHRGSQFLNSGRSFSIKSTSSCRSHRGKRTDSIAKA